MNHVIESQASRSTEPSLRDRSATGFMWFLTQTIGSKIATLVGQLVLAWLLLPEDFGLVGLAYTVTSFTSLLQEFGVREVLNRRRSAFHLWAGPAFSFSIATGVAGGLMAAACAPLAALLYDEPRVMGLIFVLACASPFWSATVAPLARLETELRFRHIATVQFCSSVGAVALSVLLAALGAGAYSFVLPRLVMGAAMLVALWRIAPIPLRGAMRIGRWRWIVGDSVLVFLSQLFRNATSQGDYFLLGLLATKPIVGLYYFAYSLSMQTGLLFSQNVAKVLLPSLASLQHNPKRQVEAALEAVGLLAFITTPACLLQAVLAGPVLRLLFDERWEGAIPLLQALSVGMAAITVAWPFNNLFDAQGRFKARMWLTAGACVFFFCIVTPAAYLYGAQGVALAVMTHLCLFAPAQMVVAMRGLRPGLGAFMRVNGRPLAVGGCAAGVAAAVNTILPEGQIGDAARIIVGTVTMSVVYSALAWIWMRDSVRAVCDRLIALATMVRQRRTLASPGM